MGMLTEEFIRGCKEIHNIVAKKRHTRIPHLEEYRAVTNDYLIVIQLIVFFPLDRAVLPIWKFIAYFRLLLNVCQNIFEIFKQADRIFFGLESSAIVHELYLS